MALEEIRSMIRYNYASSVLKLRLADVKRSYEREKYTFIGLLSDFGGFNDGIVLVPAVIMGFYNSRMYHSAKTSVFPIKRKSRPRYKSDLQKKFSADNALGT